MKLLLIDAHNLAYKALYAFGELSYQDVRTGVIYGFLRDVLDLRKTFHGHDLVFCFDSKRSIRKELFPAYKARRHSKELTPQELATLASLRKQILKLRTEYLPELGFQNILWQDGYESDDLIAATIQHLIDGRDEATIVSGDHDMYQLLAPHVQIYKPTGHKVYTLQAFKKEHGIHPRDYWRVLCLMGCKTDEVPGVKGVGLKTALRYLRKELPMGSVAYQRIRNSFHTLLGNERLVRLPLRGVLVGHDLHLSEKLSEKGWNRVTQALGMRSLKDVSLNNTRPTGFGL